MARTLTHAEPDRDAAACAAIYAPYVSDSAASFEDVAPSPAEFSDRIAQTSRVYPWLVLHDEGDLVGYAYASPHRARAAYRWAADVAVYVDPTHHRAGAGRQLYGALLDLLRRQGLWLAVAGITLPNDASIGLHRACGFEQVGVYRGIGWKAGAWRDVSWWQLRLRDPSPGSGPPPELLGPQRLDGGAA
ncbi:MAG TPA: arsinothricin resistance N-acetyltransferase ArsN1 family B [Solirubrobacteraceae bacterium]|jgi:phosphinothricin acetyltransferase|nr:arsinothricin resistance N-acetyltransferase ArsN1 family B [Solirubrobacteraceae bacterium]